VGEEPYRIDRMLTQLVRTGWFDDVAGVVVGAFTDCGAELEVQAVIDERLRPLGVPTVRGFDLGHTDSSATVPLGVEATLDADAGTLILSSSALT
jgi:muramoyltetrapeptide carboxypeptidase